MNEIIIPYKKINNFLFIKKIQYNLKKGYKMITYYYEFYKNGILIEKNIHNSNYPSILVYSNNKLVELHYYKHGKIHRDYAPAIIFLNDKHEIIKEKWFINDNELTEKEINDIKILVYRRKKLLHLFLNINYQ